MQHFVNFGAVRKANKVLKKQAITEQFLDNGIKKGYANGVEIKIPDANAFSEIRKTNDLAASPSGYLGFRNDPYKGYGGMMEEPVDKFSYRPAKPTETREMKDAYKERFNPDELVTEARTLRYRKGLGDKLKGWMPKTSQPEKVVASRGDSRLKRRDEVGLEQLNHRDRMRADWIQPRS